MSVAANEHESLIKKDDGGSSHHGRVGPSENPVGTILSSVFNLSNTVVGAGVLSLPWAFKNTGIVIGTIMLVLTWVLSNLSLRLLMAGGHKCKRYTFVDIAEASLGRAGVVITQVALIVATFGTMTSYYIVLGDMLAPLIQHYTGLCNFIGDRRFPIVCSLAVVVPLSTLRNIDQLKYTSFFALLAVVFLVIMVVVQSGKSLAGGSFFDCEQGGCFSWAKFGVGIFRAIPIITFAFCCSMNLHPIMNELHNPTKRRINVVITASMLACCVIYFIVASFGYMTFYDDISGNILLNYEVDDVYVIIGRISVAAVIIFSFPLMAHPCIHTAEHLLFRGRAPNLLRHVGMVILLCGAAFGIAMGVDDVSLSLGLTGATASTLVSFILPALFWLRLNRDRPLWSLKNFPVLIMFVLGVFFSIAATVVLLLFDADPAPSWDPCNGHNGTHA